MVSVWKALFFMRTGNVQTCIMTIHKKAKEVGYPTIACALYNFLNGILNWGTQNNCHFKVYPCMWVIPPSWDTVWFCAILVHWKKTNNVVESIRLFYVTFSVCENVCWGINCFSVLKWKFLWKMCFGCKYGLARTLKKNSHSNT